MLIYIHIGRWGVSASRVFWRLPPAHSCSGGARSWSYCTSCHWQRALASGQRPCSLDSSTLSSQLGRFGQRHADGNMTSDSGAGSRADSSDSHTLGPSSSSCSLLDFDDSTRCARHRPSNQPAQMAFGGRWLGGSTARLRVRQLLPRSCAGAGRCGRPPPPRRLLGVALPSCRDRREGP